MNRNSRVSRISVALGLALGGSPCLAAQPAPAAEDEGGLQEVIVTAQRREEGLQKVPVAVAAMRSEDLQAAGVQNFTDLQNLTPNLAIVSGVSGNYINIRGVGIGVGTPFQSAGVPLHLDGMYVPRSESFLREAYFDLESVEVYRGPQGTFAGQNSTGGAIFINAKKPQFNDFDFQLQQTIGNYRWFQTQGAANLPVSENLAVRIAFNSETRDSYTTNLGGAGSVTGAVPTMEEDTRTPGNVNRQSLRTIVRYQPTDALELRLRYDFIKERGDGGANQRTTPGTFNDPDQILTPFRIYYDYPTSNRLDVHRVSLNAVWDVSDAMQIKSVSGYQSYKINTAQDSDNYSPFVTAPPGQTTPVPQSYALNETKNRYLFQEVDLVSSGSGPLKWVIGGVVLADNGPIHTWGGNYVSTPNVLNAGPGAGSLLDYYQGHKSWALFGEVSYRFAESFEAILGGRYTEDTVWLKRGSTVRSAAPPNAILNSCAPNGTSPCNLFAIGEFSAPTGRFALNWFPNADTTVYASVSRGFKPGGYQTQFTISNTPNAQNPPYGEETITDYEIGLKTTMFDRHLRANLTAFYEDYEDYQANFRIPGVTIPRSVNIPKSKIRGFEAELTALVAGFRLTANAGYTDAEIKEGPLATVPTSQFAANCPSAAAPPAGVAACPAGTPALTYVAGQGYFIPTTGLPLNYAPRWTYNASIEYDFAVGNGRLTPRLQYSFIDEQWVQLFHASQDFIPSRELLDFRLAWDNSEHWRVEGFVTNLSDERYITSVTGGAPASPYIGGLTLGAPREYGVRFQYRY